MCVCERERESDRQTEGGRERCQCVCARAYHSEGRNQWQHVLFRKPRCVFGKVKAECRGGSTIDYVDGWQMYLVSLFRNGGTVSTAAVWNRC